MTPAKPEPAQVSSRDRLVEAAIDLIREHHRAPAAVRDVFAFLNPRSVAERAGVSRGLIYHHWGDVDSDGSEAFDRFLSTVTDELWNRVTAPDDLADMADLLPDELTAVVATLADFELARFVDDEAEGTGRAILALSLYGIGSHADTPVSVGQMAKLYERILVKLRRELVPPLTHEDLAFTLMALLDGFVLHLPAMETVITRRHRWRAVEAAEGGESNDEWSLFAVAVESMVLHMTRPVPGSVPGAASGPADRPSGSAEQGHPG